MRPGIRNSLLLGSAVAVAFVLSRALVSSAPEPEPERKRSPESLQAEEIYDAEKRMGEAFKTFQTNADGIVSPQAAGSQAAVTWTIRAERSFSKPETLVYRVSRETPDLYEHLSVTETWASYARREGKKAEIETDPLKIKLTSGELQAVGGIKAAVSKAAAKLGPEFHLEPADADEAPRTGDHSDGIAAVATGELNEQLNGKQWYLQRGPTWRHTTYTPGGFPGLGKKNTGHCFRVEDLPLLEPSKEICFIRPPRPPEADRRPAGFWTVRVIPGSANVSLQVDGTVLFPEDSKQAAALKRTMTSDGELLFQRASELHQVARAANPYFLPKAAAAPTQ
jgi:hypothetical protein